MKDLLQISTQAKTMHAKQTESDRFLECIMLDDKNVFLFCTSFISGWKTDVFLVFVNNNPQGNLLIKK